MCVNAVHVDRNGAARDVLPRTEHAEVINTRVSVFGPPELSL